MAAEYDSIKQMPYSLEAEQAILGSVILDPENISVISSLKPEEFYLEQHRIIFTAIRDLYTLNKAVDLVTLIDRINSSAEKINFDVQKYIRMLCDISAVNSNINEYVNIVRDKAVLRALIAASGDISEHAFSATDESKYVVDFAEQRIYDIANGRENKSFRHIADVLKDNYVTLQDLFQNPDKERGIKTGFSGIDDLLVHLGDGDLVIVGARPGVGKTSFCLNVAGNAAKMHPDASIAIFSLEMSDEELVNRMICTEAQLESYKLRSAKLTEQDWFDLSNASCALSETQIYIDDTGNITVTEMKSKLRRLSNLKLVIIDYLQLMKSDQSNDNRVLEIADITRGLKLMAKDLHVPVILCSQLSRPPKGVKEKRPVASDLRDSGAIEQDADIIMLLYKEEDGSSEKNQEGNAPSQPPEAQDIECIIAKNRHGAPGTVPFMWYGKYFKFVEVETKFDGQTP